MTKHLFYFKKITILLSVPSAYEELQIALAGRSPDYQGVIVERMIKCTHPSLGSGNKEKLTHLFKFLLQHLHDSAAADEDENVICPFSVYFQFMPLQSLSLVYIPVI